MCLPNAAPAKRQAPKQAKSSGMEHPEPYDRQHLAPDTDDPIASGSMAGDYGDFCFQIDCNTYFASCEVATRPGTEGKPLVVANETENGGGVILALTAEAKALGLKRGTPLFKVRDILSRQGVIICPVDHKKYRRISHTIMQAVQEQGIVLNFVQYSVDEFFGTLPLTDPGEARHYARKVMDLIWEVSHVPVGCGISLTNTLAKTATWFAKRYRGYHGVCVITAQQRERALALVPVGEVWGIGRRQRARLEAAGIVTALDLARTPRQQLEPIMNTAGLHTWADLRGQRAVELKNHSRQQSIMQSHTFAEMTRDKHFLDVQVAAFTNRCAVTLRSQKSLCSSLMVFVSTNRYRADLPQYRNSVTLSLPRPTSNTPLLLKTARQALDQLFRPGFLYKQAGVVLLGITPDEGQQLDLFTVEQDERQRRLMQVADSLNRRFGEGTITLGPLQEPASN